MQTKTERFQSEGLPGQYAQGEMEQESLNTGYIGQISRHTIGDAAYVPTIYHVEVVVTDGLTITFDYDGTLDANATAAAVGMVAAWNNYPPARQLGLAVVTAAKSMDVAWADYTRSYTPTLSSDDVATFTHTVFRAASSQTARFGVAVVYGAVSSNPTHGRLVAPLTSATTAAQVRGIVMREDVGVEQPSLEPSANSYDYYPAGRAAPIGNRGRCWVVCETAMAVDGAIYVRKSGTGIIGAFRNDADGGDAIDYSAYAKVEVAGVAGKTCKIKINVAL